jgi:dephospho-CoA kinase
MMRIGLTGSIASGKSTVATYFGAHGIPIFDSDVEVHALYREPHFVQKLEAAFPGSTDQQGVSRDKLSQLVLDKPAQLQKLELMVHPEIRDREKKFFAEHQAKGSTIAVADIPLLFEKSRDGDFDKIILVCAPETARKQRAFKRPGMTEQKWQAILRHQLPEAEKRERAHVIIENTGTLEDLQNKAAEIIRELRKATEENQT